MENTTIAINKETKELLKKLGSKGDTFDNIIRTIYETYEDFLNEQYRRLGEKEKFTELK